MECRSKALSLSFIFVLITDFINIAFYAREKTYTPLGSCMLADNTKILSRLSVVLILAFSANARKSIAAVKHLFKIPSPIAFQGYSNGFEKQCGY